MVRFFVKDIFLIQNVGKEQWVTQIVRKYFFVFLTD